MQTPQLWPQHVRLANGNKYGAGEYIAMLDVQQRTRDTATCGVESYREKIMGTEAVSTLLAP